MREALRISMNSLDRVSKQAQPAYNHHGMSKMFHFQNLPRGLGKKMRGDYFSKSRAAGLTLYWFIAWVSLAHLASGALETGSGGCGPRISIEGDFSHKKSRSAEVEGATHPEMYGEEIQGREFSVFVEGLPEGLYAVEIYMAEQWTREKGKRVMDIVSGDVVFARDFDLFAEAGFAKEFILKGVVPHRDDSINGPLTIQFERKQNLAQFNGIIIRDDTGKTVACVYASDLYNEDDRWASAIPEIAEPPVFRDARLPFEVRVDDLIRRMSIAEKAHQLMNSAPPIERLGVPGYDYWNECLHGVARAGTATVFPQAIGLAAMWDEDMMHRIADTIATEGRAKNNAARAENPNTNRYEGLTFWTPNINIFRDPRWGRGQETYGEDPFLTGRLAVAFIRGLQGDDPKYIKAMACAKHFAVHSGPEKLRHTFNAVVSERDLHETYLPQFEAAVREGKVGIIMSVYNAIDGVPGPANAFFLTEILRERWGFQGHVVSDCGAVSDIWKRHKYVETPAEASALAIKAGNDLNCGRTFKWLTNAVRKGLLTEGDLDRALKRVMLARFRLGLFDDPEECPFLKISPKLNDAPAHGVLALEAARRSIVLLKNDGVLPLKEGRYRSIAVIGPNADSLPVLLGNYHGEPSNPVTVLEGIRNAVAGKLEVSYAPGSPLALERDEIYSLESPLAKAALETARDADVIIFVGGLDATLEAEQKSSKHRGFDGGDRITIELPQPQSQILRALHATGKPVIFVNLSGSAIAMPWAAENLEAILQAWYPGQNGGTAVADVLFGNYNPSGRLPVTFYRSTEDLPDFLDYSMEGRTYRYFDGEPLFAFGFGLSYTEFSYGDISVERPSMKPDETIRVSIPVSNVGERDGTEVVQLYVRHLDSPIPQPRQSLAGFQTLFIEAGEVATANFDLPASSLRYWDGTANNYVVPKGPFQIGIGASSDDIRATLELDIE